jgi:hypothetical protein
MVASSRTSVPTRVAVLYTLDRPECLQSTKDRETRPSPRNRPAGAAFAFVMAVSIDDYRAPGAGAEFFLVEGVLVAVTHTAKNEKHAFAYTPEGPRAYDLRTGVPNARRISEEEFMVRLAHVQLSHATPPDGEQPNVPVDGQD